MTDLQPSASALSAALLRWVAAGNLRDLPWRVEPRDPYAVWVSEIMLQQTQVATVTPYLERWLALFPTVNALAAASQSDVLKAWEGLGYYSRARNLHKAARLVVAEHGGQLPADRKALLALPGIGRYTAGAILSIAFGQRAAALDGNVKRVLARVYDIDADVGKSATTTLLWQLAEALVDAVEPQQAGSAQRGADGPGRDCLHAARTALFRLSAVRSMSGSASAARRRSDRSGRRASRCRIST